MNRYILRSQAYSANMSLNSRQPVHITTLTTKINVLIAFILAKDIEVFPMNSISHYTTSRNTI